MDVLHALIPGALDTPTGGFGYDRRVLAGLAALGWPVRVHTVPGGWPQATAAERAEAAAVLAGLPDGALLLADGLAWGTLPDLAHTHRDRLRLVALVHHPLADEGGIAPARRAAMIADEAAALAAARAVICTSRTTAARLTDGFGVSAERITVAPPGTAPAARAPADATPPLILALGALVPRKGHDVLIDALARLGHLPWRARIVGAPSHDPACAAALARQIRAAGLEERVRLAGAVGDAGLELAAASIFALATRHEGYGMAFAEALARGLPVIGTTAGAVPEVVPEGAGILVAPGDAAAFAAALGAVLADPGRRAAMAARAWEAGQALPDWPETVARIDRALRAVT